MKIYKCPKCGKTNVYTGKINEKCIWGNCDYIFDELTCSLTEVKAQPFTICPFCNQTHDEPVTICSNSGCKFDNSLIELYDKMYDQNMAERKYMEELASRPNIPTCPTCGSTDLHRISNTEKAVNTGIFGLFGTKRNKTFRCNNCKYEW